MIPTGNLNIEGEMGINYPHVSFQTTKCVPLICNGRTQFKVGAERLEGRKECLHIVKIIRVNLEVRQIKYMHITNRAII